MRRDQLEHANRTAYQIIQQPEVIVVGSQAILDTAVLPEGWRDRLVKVQNANTAAPAGEPRFTGWCLDKEDLCVAKLCAFREKGRNFVAALLNPGLVDGEIISTRLGAVPDVHLTATGRALSWLASKASS